MRLAAASATVLLVCTLVACGDDPEQRSASHRSVAVTSTDASQPETGDDADLLSLNAACARIWNLFKRHGDMPVGTSWDALVTGARRVLERSKPDVVAILGPEVDAFEEATIETYDRNQVFLAIRRGDRLVSDFATSCGDTIVRTIDRAS